MCGRATLAKTPKQLEKRYQASAKFGDNSPIPNYNIAPTHWHPVITSDVPEGIQLFKWGLIPFWAKDTRIGSRLINARSETVLEKPAFRSIHKKRCLVPLDGFYEWKKEGTNKIPYRIILPKTDIFSVAGIWERWENPEKEIISTFTILTQAPNTLMRAIHDRMPAILYPEQERIWLDMDLSAREVLQIIAPFPADLMKAYRVSNRVNKVRENDKDLLEEVPGELPNLLF